MDLRKNTANRLTAHGKVNELDEERCRRAPENSSADQEDDGKIAGLAEAIAVWWVAVDRGSDRLPIKRRAEMLN